MSEIKVDELTGIQLDFCVFESENIDVKPYIFPDKSYHFLTEKGVVLHCDWNFIMPIVQNNLMISPSGEVEHCDTFSNDKDLLIAIKRCIVKRKYGEVIKNVKM